MDNLDIERPENLEKRPFSLDRFIKYVGLYPTVAILIEFFNRFGSVSESFEDDLNSLVGEWELMRNNVYILAVALSVLAGISILVTNSKGKAEGDNGDKDVKVNPIVEMIPSVVLLLVLSTFSFVIAEMVLRVIYMVSN